MLLEYQMGKGNHETSWFISGQFHIASDEILYRLGRTVVDGYTRLMLKMDVVQHAPLPDGPKIIAANHPTTTDPFFIITLVSEQMSVLVSGGIFEVPVFGRYLRLAGHVPVVHNSGGATIEAARRLLEAGRTVAIFSEGALSPLEGGIGFHKPHSGVARLALSTGAPVIPVGISLQRERIRFVETKVDGEPEVGRFYLRGPYAMTVGEPMRFKRDVEDWEYVRSVSERIMQRITHLSRESALRVQESQAFETGAITRPIGVASIS